MIYCDTDLPAFYVHSERTARKPHRCCECRAPIEVGERHFVCRGKWHGTIETYRQHLTCLEACMLIRDEFADGECIVFGGLNEWYEENRLDLRGSWPKVLKLRGLLARIRVRERKARTGGRAMP